MYGIFTYKTEVVALVTNQQIANAAGGPWGRHHDFPADVGCPFSGVPAVTLEVRIFVTDLAADLALDVPNLSAILEVAVHRALQLVGLGRFK